VSVTNPRNSDAVALEPYLLDPAASGAVIIETVIGSAYRLSAGGQLEDLTRSIGAGTLVTSKLHIDELPCASVRPGDVIEALPERPSAITRVFTVTGIDDPTGAYFETVIARLRSQGAHAREAVFVPLLDRDGDTVGLRVAGRAHRPTSARRLRGLVEGALSSVVASDDDGLVVKLGRNMRVERAELNDGGAATIIAVNEVLNPLTPAPLTERPLGDLFGFEPTSLVEVPDAGAVPPVPVSHRDRVGLAFDSVATTLSRALNARSRALAR